jgi:transcriptional regulator with XRE-family HTH domain
MGSSLRHYRALLGLTQSSLAKRAGISQAYLSQVESGRRARISASILRRLADAVGVTVTDLMEKEVLTMRREERIESWLYQMRPRPEWGALDYARDVREGRLLAGHWDESESKIYRLGGRLPGPGDLIILFWVRTGAARPGLAGFGVITEFDKQRRLRFRALPPTRTLQSAPRWSPTVENLVEGIRTVAEGTMWRITDPTQLQGILAEVFAEVHDRWLRDWSRRGSTAGRARRAFARSE